MANPEITPASTPTPITPTTLTTSDGRQLSALRGGTGETLVVFEAGLGMPAAYWLPVMRLLAPTHRVLAYDRAGYGSSTPDSLRRTRTRLAHDLVDVAVSEETSSVILVGHSWGGPIMYEASRILAEKVHLGGLVAVDPSDPHFADDFTPWQLALYGKLLVAAAHIGLAKYAAKPLVRAMPAEDAAQVCAAVGSVAAAKAQKAELRDFIAGLRTTPLDLPNVPIRIISGTKNDKGESRAQRETVNNAHRRTAAIVDGEFVPAPNSSHAIPCTEPELIARVIRDLG